MASRHYYKGKYAINFYTDDEMEYLVYSFNNVREILAFLHIPITRKTVNWVSRLICRVLKSQSHTTRAIDGRPRRLYLVDMVNYDEEEI